MGAVAEIGAGGSLNHRRRWCWVFFEQAAVRTAAGGSVGGGTGQWLSNSRGRRHWALFGGGRLFKKWWGWWGRSVVMAMGGDRHDRWWSGASTWQSRRWRWRRGGCWRGNGSGGGGLKKGGQRWRGNWRGGSEWRRARRWRGTRHGAGGRQWGGWWGADPGCNSPGAPFSSRAHCPARCPAHCPGIRRRRRRRIRRLQPKRPASACVSVRGKEINRVLTRVLRSGRRWRWWRW